MSVSLRPVVGFSAAFATVALVAIAGMMAPRVKTTSHASAGCQDKAAEAAPASRPGEAERPA